ncbi:MAG TPA: thiamine diphosphokinase [Candidatus Cloacimonadota bacterium]|nr:thiamine diphosphokinase [Candidatus Cloacimonadota bacterium]
MPSADRTAYVFPNHAPVEIVSGYASIAGDVIAVDGGLQRVHDLGLIPACIIGDFDSVDPALLSLYADIPIVRHQPEKNETDTELALHECLSRACYDQIVICNNMQGRFDHAMGILQNLLMLHEHGISARVESSFQIFFFISARVTLKVIPQSVLSLIPWSDEVRFSDSRGLAYPLTDLCIRRSQSRGISNICLVSEPEILLDSGTALAIITPPHPSRNA